MTSSQLNEAQKEYVIDYLVFKKIQLLHGGARVVVWHVTEGRPCFSAAFSSHVTYTYDCRRTPVGWIAQLIGRPSPLIPFSTKRYATMR